MANQRGCSCSQLALVPPRRLDDRRHIQQWLLSGTLKSQGSPLSWSTDTSSTGLQLQGFSISRNLHQFDLEPIHNIRTTSSHTELYSPLGGLDSSLIGRAFTLYALAVLLTRVGRYQGMLPPQFSQFLHLCLAMLFTPCSTCSNVFLITPVLHVVLNAGRRVLDLANASSRPKIRSSIASAI